QPRCGRLGQRICDAGEPDLGLAARIADRVRPQLCVVDVRGRGAGRRGDPGGATVVGAATMQWGHAPSPLRGWGDPTRLRGTKRGGGGTSRLGGGAAPMNSALPGVSVL